MRGELLAKEELKVLPAFTDSCQKPTTAAAQADKVGVRD